MSYRGQEGHTSLPLCTTGAMCPVEGGPPVEGSTPPPPPGRSQPLGELVGSSWREDRGGAHLAVAVVHPEGHAGRHEQQQRLLLRQLLLQPLHGLAALVGPLWEVGEEAEAQLSALGSWASCSRLAKPWHPYLGL